ncbi:hypothetical protein ISN45_Aa03g029570 [Arabidopsis thaliana x Arabidopsis arenosa]|uniref:DUF1985 domain-containing protein n=1 Tax=Arabidopsis thaliana x Arabidopsis arenosa TaxID=1240361 RepID=A0A8T2B463_9BRAS|nr:hypothetical protein ISN45_Aa03g029570 [Arabidopsis thaliana x Arabidopsis arenosa]
MARTKNATVVPTEHEADPVLGEEEEDLPREDPGKEPEDYEEAEQNSMDSEDETEPLRPLKMYFSPSDYVKPFKLSSKCYIHQAVKLLRGHLSVGELKWFLEHPQFKHFFHMHTGSNHKLMGMWMLLLRTACLDKKKECWFVVNGVPIRYSIQEFALSSGLFCHSYPKNYEAIGSDMFSGKHFGATGTVTYARVKDKLLSMKRSNPDRLKMAVLYLLCSVIVGKRKTGPLADPVEDLFLRAVEDLEWCKTFPWGRFAFEHNMKDIFHLLDHFDGGLGAQWVFPSFVMPLEILAFEAIPNLMNQFREHVVSADPECPRMCKMKFKPSSMKGFPMSELYDSLGTTMYNYAAI